MNNDEAYCEWRYPKLYEKYKKEVSKNV